jgi:imidazoleglycerol phosphate synthase glutamine amidotransferase subunit HisH
LAAAAVSCSRSTLDLIPAAVQAVTAAFRTGVRVIDVARRIEPTDASMQSWSIIVPGVAAAEAAVTEFNEQTVRSPIHKADPHVVVLLSADRVFPN